MKGDFAKVFLILVILLNVFRLVREVTIEQEYRNAASQEAVLNGEMAREVKAEIESTFLLYEQIDYVSARVTVSGQEVTHVTITFDGPNWTKYLNHLVLELKKIVPSARLWIFNLNAEFVYQE